MARKHQQRVKNQITMAVNPINGQRGPASPLQGSQPMTPAVRQNLSNFIAPVQLQRIKYDVKLWREAVMEAEFAYYPHRVKMQRMFRDTALNGHVKACVQKRKRMTTLRTFRMMNGDTELEDLTNVFKNKWFYDFTSYCMDATNYGYSLISLGSIVDSMLKSVSLIQRWNVSPDRFIVGSYVYAQTGKSFFDADVVDWHVYVDTPSEDGQSPCGYGLFYNLAIYEIILRNNLGFNTDFVERFSMPYVHGKTTKTNEEERDLFEKGIANMGSNGYAITDPLDEIEFLEAALAGTGWNGYDNLEQRLEKKISKLILGHADAMDSTPGKLGGGQDGEDSPAAKALSEIQSEDGRMMEQIINGDLIPKLQRLGFPIPEGTRFVYSNDDEKEEARNRQDTSNKTTAEVVKTLKEAGFKVSTEYITERTGIPVEEAEEPQPIEPEEVEADGKKPTIPTKIKNKLKLLYS